MATVIPLTEPYIAGNEWTYVKECLDTGWVSSVGSYVERFEREIAEFIGAKHAVATCNGTSALHIALLVAGVQPDDEVIVSALTFIAPANAIRYIGAWPVFVDSEPTYWQMDPEKVVMFLDEECVWRDDALYNRSTGRRVRAIIPVHILGHPVDMDPILEAALKYKLVIIEDATESLGATYKGRPVGTLGDLDCLSFNGNKLITTGGGGMLLTNNSAWASRAKYLTTQAKDDGCEYIHREIGYNYRLTNIQAAVGCAQLEMLREFVSKKRAIAQRYSDALSDIPGILPMSEAPWAYSAYWMYTALFDDEQLRVNSRGLLRELSERGIQTRPLWQPLHLSTAHSGAFATDCSVAVGLYQKALSLPCSVGLEAKTQQEVIAAIKSITGE